MKNDVIKIKNELEEAYPEAKCALNYSSDWQLLVAVVLSAQCTDVRVNKVTPPLFKKYPNIENFKEMSTEELIKYIRSTGFFNNKAKNILAAAKKIITDFNGHVPAKMNELITIPGIGGKSANVILSEWFKINEGIAVDTHVTRLSRRIGLSDEKTPEKIEKDLMRQLPKEEWRNFSTLLVNHGRKICKARKPDCDNCVLNKLCRSAFKV
jgi:endonuclease III